MVVFDKICVFARTFRNTVTINSCMGASMFVYCCKLIHFCNFVLLFGKIAKFRLESYYYIIVSYVLACLINNDQKWEVWAYESLRFWLFDADFFCDRFNTKFVQRILCKWKAIYNKFYVSALNTRINFLSMSGVLKIR